MSKKFSNIKRLPLLLHVDINRTIIATDLAGGKDISQIMQCNVCSSSYGEVLDGKWVFREPPKEVDIFKNNNNNDTPTLISYTEYVDTILCPIPKDLNKNSINERLEVMKKIRKNRQLEYSAFLEPNGAGNHLKWAFDKQKNALKRKKGCVETEIKNIKDEFWSIIPSFFKMLNTLSDCNWPFIIFFRTFGCDLENVMTEFKEFVFGNLDYKPTGPVLQHIRDSWIDPVIGAIFRNDSGIFITWGVSSPPPHPSLEYNSIEESLNYLHTLDKYKTAKYLPSDGLLDAMLEAASRTNNVAGLVDYFQYWSANGEKKRAGKICQVNNKMYHVFFDDNIFFFKDNNKSIVDFRGPNGETIDDIHALPYAVTVQPYNAITDEDYFINALEDKLKLQTIHLS